MYAQVSLGPQIGLNISTIEFNFNGNNEPESMFKVGPIAGAVLDIHVNEHMAIQPKVLYVSRGGKYEVQNSGAEEQVTVNLNYLSFPIDFVYNIHMGAGQFQFFAGPIIEIGLGGNIKTSEERDVDFDSEVDPGSGTVTLNGPLNVSLNFGFGYWIPFEKNALQVTMGYFAGLTNLSPSDPNDSSFQNDHKQFNRGIEIKAAYLFGLGKKE